MSTFSPRVLCMNQVVNPSSPAPCSHLSQGGGGLHGLCGNRVRGQESCCAARVYAQKGGGGGWGGWCNVGRARTLPTAKEPDDRRPFGVRCAYPLDVQHIEQLD